ncbi:hypothetical protein PENTCL1PPCAC_3029, partial [Pristionchus entomophagus]
FITSSIVFRLSRQCTCGTTRRHWTARTSLESTDVMRYSAHCSISIFSSTIKSFHLTFSPSRGSCPLFCSNRIHDSQILVQISGRIHEFDPRA